MDDRIFETFPFAIIRLDSDHQILRKNKKASEYFQHINSHELSALLKTFIEQEITSWTGSNNQTFYIKHFQAGGSSDSLILMGTDPDFESNVPAVFEQRIEDFPDDPSGVIDRLVDLISDAVTFERMDILRIQTGTDKYTFDFSLGINIERAWHTAFTDLKDTGVTWLIQHEIPYVAHDIEQDIAGFSEDPLLLQTGFNSSLRIPIIVNHGVVGAIMFASSDVGRFKLEDAFLILQFAKHIAQAYFHSGLKLERSYEKLTATAFLQTVASLLDETNIKDFLGEYCYKLRTAAKMDHVSFFLLNEAKYQRLCLAEAGNDSLDKSEWLPIPDRGMKEMFQTKSIVAFNITNPAYKGADHLIGQGFTSIIYSPITINGQIVAALGGVSSDERALHSFTAGLYKFSSEHLSHIIEKIPLEPLFKPSPAKHRKPCQGVHQGFHNIIGTSSVIQETIRNSATAAQYEFPILITGETGTGKELFAKAIHQTSKVADGPFIVVNSAAIPENLLESELFGYQEGAFTGGLKGGKRGKIFLADGGTLFLDEIGELSPDLQAKLLRVIQEQEVEPLGSTKPIAVHVRIISATHRDLKQMVQEGEFREDLLYRLNAIEIKLPPLRERGNDIIELAEQMLDDLAQRHGVHTKIFSAGARELLVNFNWPGNVRQLQNIINRLFVFVESETILPKDLPPDFRCAPENQSETETEKEKMERLLSEYKGNKTALAQFLGITRTGLWKKLKRLGLQ